MYSSKQSITSTSVFTLDVNTVKSLSYFNVKYYHFKINFLERYWTRKLYQARKRETNCWGLFIVPKVIWKESVHGIYCNTTIKYCRTWKSGKSLSEFLLDMAFVLDSKSSPTPNGIRGSLLPMHSSAIMNLIPFWITGATCSLLKKLSHY